jgi:hypothetical protein
MGGSVETTAAADRAFNVRADALLAEEKARDLHRNGLDLEADASQQVADELYARAGTLDEKSVVDAPGESRQSLASRAETLPRTGRGLITDRRAAPVPAKERTDDQKAWTLRQMAREAARGGDDVSAARYKAAYKAAAMHERFITAARAGDDDRAARFLAAGARHEQASHSYDPIGYLAKARESLANARAATDREDPTELPPADGQPAVPERHADHELARE